ncbi:hypothetical protein BBP40_006673 [Aspergillus hancockii]|nr:hypothetical protein BBP40_006673 [Aspergillus hancockii]
MSNGKQAISFITSTRVHLLAETFYRIISHVADDFGFPNDLRHLALDLFRKHSRPRDALREFVTSHAVALKPEYVHGPFIDFIGFGGVILSRICWSTSDDRSMDNKDGVSQGAWAGHMLDIVPLDTIDIDKSWKEIAEIWKRKYGEDWRNIVIAEKESGDNDE